MGRTAAIFGVWAMSLVPETIGATGFRGFQVAARPVAGVRTTDQSVTLLEEGFRRSVTLGQLAADIAASDIRVQVHFSNEPGIWRGETSFVAATTGLRILRTRINAALEKQERLAVLGHELQHVREVASAPDIVDQLGMMRFFERLGFPSSPGSRNYETSAAQRIERQVRAELAISR